MILPRVWSAADSSSSLFRGIKQLYFAIGNVLNGFTRVMGSENPLSIAIINVMAVLVYRVTLPPVE